MPIFARRPGEQANTVQPRSPRNCSRKKLDLLDMKLMNESLDSMENTPEPVSDLPDDDWDSWLAGARDYPGRRF